MSDFTKRAGEPAVTYDVSPSESISEGVIAAVAAVSGATPAPRASTEGPTLDPLTTVVDPDALDAVFRAGAASTRGRVSFAYEGHRVTVCNDGHITVEGVDGAPCEASD